MDFEAVRLSAALIGVRRVVNEIIVVFLGTLPLDPLPESKPFTPLRRPCGGCTRVTPRGGRIIPDRPNGDSPASTALRSHHPGGLSY